MSENQRIPTEYKIIILLTFHKDSAVPRVFLSAMTIYRIDWKCLETYAEIYYIENIIFFHKL